ncbi:hypothetical protein BT69DRAFT_1289162 [Atractiella rhizophila]|nr:hypothetical protein BT69DRAFT_1289162 [Atractiella rhizophila]
MPKDRTPLPSTPSPEARIPRNVEEFIDGKKEASRYTNPCAMAQSESMKCLDKYNYNHSMCEDFFENYRECKTEWYRQMKAARSLTTKTWF